MAASPNSYAAYLRALPLKPVGAPVRLYSGKLKARQDVHAAVLDLDVGPRDLQQCADSVIRLRAEYLFTVGRVDAIAFHFTSGFLCPFSRWRQGFRIEVSGSSAAWARDGTADSSEASLHRYLDTVFTYAGTASLPRDLEPERSESAVEPGDVFLRPGSPGHAMIVVDVAECGPRRAILLAQGYMPAQDIHVVRNPAASDGDPWYGFQEGAALSTPEWTFAWTELRRFPDPR